MRFFSLSQYMINFILVFEGFPIYSLNDKNKILFEKYTVIKYGKILNIYARKANSNLLNQDLEVSILIIDYTYLQ